MSAMEQRVTSQVRPLSSGAEDSQKQEDKPLTGNKEVFNGGLEEML
jgi:hypothetical protein